MFFSIDSRLFCLLVFIIRGKHGWQCKVLVVAADSSSRRCSFKCLHLVAGLDAFVFRYLNGNENRSQPLGSLGKKIKCKVLFAQQGVKERSMPYGRIASHRKHWDICGGR